MKSNLRSCLVPLPIHSDQVQNSPILAKPKEVSDGDLGLNEDEYLLDAEDKSSPSEIKNMLNQSNGKHDLKTHINTVHDGKNSFKCDTCVCEFAEYEGLKCHIDAAHEGMKTFKCNVSGMNLLGQIELNSHMTSTHGPSTSLASSNTQNCVQMFHLSIELFVARIS